MPKKIVKIYTYIIRSECVNDIIHKLMMQRYGSGMKDEKTGPS